MPIVLYHKIKPLRLAKGLRQSEIAIELAISRPTYTNIERGKKEPTISQLFILARLLGVPPSTLCASLKDG